MCNSTSTIDSLTDELFLEIFNPLSLLELNVCRLVSHHFCRLASDEKFVSNKVLSKMAFGKMQWETHFGEIGDAPEPPPLETLKPYFKDYILVLLPTQVNRLPLSLEHFISLANQPKLGKKISITVSDKVITMYGKKSIEKSLWLLFSKKIPENADSIKNFPQVLDTVIALATRQIFTGETCLSNKLTFCQETIDDNHLLVGDPESAGLIVREYTFMYQFFPDFLGIAKVLKFS